MVDTRRVWRITWPVILGNISVPLVGAVDVAVLGRVEGTATLAAIGLATTIVSLIFWGFSFLRFSTVGLVAQALGRDEPSAIRLVVLRGLLIALIAAALIVVLMPALISMSLAVVSVEPMVATAARHYLEIRLWSAPATLSLYVIGAWLIGSESPKRHLLLQLALNLINIVLTLWLVQGLGMGIAGAALGSVIAEYLALALGMRWLIKSVGFRPWPNSTALLDRHAWLSLMRFNRDIMLRTLALLLSFSLFTFYSAQLGTLVLAANTVLLQFQHIVAFGLDGFAHAAETLAGQALGRRSKDMLRGVIRKTAQGAIALASITAVVMWLARDPLIGLFSDDPLVVETVSLYFPWLIVSPIVSVWCFLLDGIFIGLSRAREMRNAMLASAASYALLLVTMGHFWGNHGAWLALLLFMVLRALTLKRALGRELLPEASAG
ncbi:MATE family efflux transporter [Gammaproteobacteria bacterium]|nr:MATE family efflux transporter [Gammaproteobacteria bacterium]